jgi:hypothetical protein
VTEIDHFVEKHASALRTLRMSGVVRKVEVKGGCLFVHAEAGSERIRTLLLREIKSRCLTDLRVSVTVNPALLLAELHGKLATGVATVGLIGGSLQVGPK